MRGRLATALLLGGIALLVTATPAAAEPVPDPGEIAPAQPTVPAPTSPTAPSTPTSPAAGDGGMLLGVWLAAGAILLAALVVVTLRVRRPGR